MKSKHFGIKGSPPKQWLETQYMGHNCDSAYNLKIINHIGKLKPRETFGNFSNTPVHFYSFITEILR
jgi:hypothetical protein